jgi:hypothetical protein
MYTWRNLHVDMDYAAHVMGDNSLSKAVVKKILRTPFHEIRRTRRWRYQNFLNEWNQHVLNIGCQKFGPDAVYALKRWVGLPV